MTAKSLLRNLTVANQLTFLRLVAIPFFILSVLQGRFTIAVVLFVGAALTRFVREPGANRAINVAFAVLLVASVAFAMLF